MTKHTLFKFSLNPKTLKFKTTINLKPDFRTKENKNKKGLKLFYAITKTGSFTF